MKKRPITFIKLGGSVITDKDVPLSLRPKVLTRLVQEITRARAENPNRLFIVGHGQGSFAHVPAAQYQTMQGFINDQSLYGMAVVLDSAASLNRIVVQEFLKMNVPAVSLMPSSMVITHERKAQTYFEGVFDTYLQRGLFSITCGDVLVDTAQGCTIWSTEDVLTFFAKKFLEQNWPVEQIIHVTEVDGVYDHAGQVIPKITAADFDSIKTAIGKAKGFDVTGGMLMKVTQALELAKSGIPSKILSGLHKENLYKVLTNQEWIGTTIQ